MSSSESRHRAPSLPSTASIHNTHSVRSNKRAPPPTSSVVTSPPWARDEPPSPKEEHGSYLGDRIHDTQSRISADVASYASSPTAPDSRWWAFTRPRNTAYNRTDSIDFPPVSPTKSERRTFRDISLAWMPTSSSLRETTGLIRKDKDKETENGTVTPLQIPPAAQIPGPYTLAHTATPGWDTPWTPKHDAQGPVRQAVQESSYPFEDHQSHDETKDDPASHRRRKKLRAFILTNAYVPLLFRFINMAFTTAALGISIRIRGIEIQNNILGAVGSSPTVVIIFAPLTLVHVISAIYLEYFGRPLGLWRTSAKLAHTLSEVLFICLWSAALSLSFDNFFTSIIPCASTSSTSWYNQLPRPPNDIPDFEDSVGDRICDFQLSLICLVGVGLIAYCSNLIISLFRIFEKVKYHPTHMGGPRQ